MTPEKLDRPDPATRELLDFCHRVLRKPTLQGGPNAERTDADAVNLDTPTLDAMNLDLPTAEFERQIIARLPPRHRDFAKEVFRAGREVLVRWRIERARRRRGRGTPNP